LGSKVSGLSVGRGDRIRLETAGGGGHGDPRKRDAAALDEDLAQGYVSAEGAARSYGK
jgi:N-methylhydantoinase B